MPALTNDNFLDQCNCCRTITISLDVFNNLLHFDHFDSIQQAGVRAYRVAVQHLTSPSVCAACVAFTEMLGLDSTALRIDIQAASRVLDHAKLEDVEEAIGRRQRATFYVVCGADSLQSRPSTVTNKYTLRAKAGKARSPSPIRRGHVTRNPDIFHHFIDYANSNIQELIFTLVTYCLGNKCSNNRFVRDCAFGDPRNALF